MNNLDKFKRWLILNGYSSFTYLPLIKKVINTIPEFSEESISNFIFNQQNKLSPETVNLYIKAMRAYLKFMKKEINTPKYFKVPKKLPDFITIEFFEQEIIPAVEDLFPKDKLRKKTILYFMFYAGLRKSEMYLLQRKFFNLAESEVKIYVPKTQEERLIPLNYRMVEMLREYFNSEPEKNNAFNLRVGEIDYIFKLLKPNFPKIRLRPHLLRHSTAMNLQRNGFTTREIQVLLGHKNIQTALRYEGADISLMKEKIKEMIK
jgi:site-specific recombinase XerD